MNTPTTDNDGADKNRRLAIARDFVGRYCDPINEGDADVLVSALLDAAQKINAASPVGQDALAAGSCTDEPNPNGSPYARLNWWKDRADEDAEEIQRLRDDLEKLTSPVGQDALAADLKWMHDRLDHLLAVYTEGCMAKDDFSGPDETMQWVREFLPKIRTRHGFTSAWPEGRDKALEKLRVRNVPFASASQANPTPAPSSDAVEAFDIEAMICACLPGGHYCDPQQVADAIREYAAKLRAARDGSEGKP